MSRTSTLQRRMLAGFIGGTVLGVASAHFLGGTDILRDIIHYVTQPVGQLYLRLLFMLVIPLVFSALCLGVSGIGDLGALGRIGIKTLVYTVAISAVAVCLGVTIVNVLQPGAGFDADTRAKLIASASRRASILTSNRASMGDKSAIELIVGIVPDNFVQAAAASDMLAVMFFALMFGVGLTLVRTPASQNLRDMLQGLYDVTLRLVDLVLQLAPYGVAALMFTLTAELGYAILGQLLRYVLVVLVALALHQFVVYSVVLRFLGKMSPIKFFKSVREAMLIAFSTASSNASLPTSIRVADENLALPPEISRFVLTLGSTANQNGTALFEGVTVLFLAQLYGVDLSLLQQALVVFVCVLGGVGTAGIPAGSIPVVAMILGMVGVPSEGIGVILGVDRFLDMCRTTLNVTGDLVAAVVIARSEETT